MQALQFTHTGDLGFLTLCDLPKPQPQNEEVLVRVQAAGLNPSDVKNVLGLFPHTRVPRVAGRDFAGVVEAGPSAWLNKEVWGCALENGFNKDGSHAKYLLTSAHALIEKPSNLSVTQAASLGVPYATAAELFKRAQLAAHARILILGAGAVARAFANILHAHQHQAVFAARNPQAQQTLRAQGYACLDLNQNLPAQVQQHFGRLADFVLDSSGFLIDSAVQCAANFAKVAVIAAPASGEITFPVKEFYRRSLTLIGINSLIHNNKICNDFLRELVPLIQTGKLLIDEPRALPISQGVQAYQELQQGQSIKTVFTFN
ncbi:MAG: hypothetical protein RL217_1569 [Pseudomonadota bacterium]